MDAMDIDDVTLALVRQVERLRLNDPDEIALIRQIEQLHLDDDPDELDSNITLDREEPMLGDCDDVEQSQSSQSSSLSSQSFMEESQSSDFQFDESQTSSFSSSTPYVKYLPTIFSPASHVPYMTTTNNWITAYFNEYTASLSNVERFTRYCRPSFRLNYNQLQSQSGPDNFVIPTTKWIAVNRGLSSLESTSLPRIPELKAAFDALASVHQTNGHPILTVSKLDNLAIKYNILSGKWLIFTGR